MLQTPDLVRTVMPNNSIRTLQGYNHKNLQPEGLPSPVTTVRAGEHILTLVTNSEQGAANLRQKLK